MTTTVNLERILDRKQWEMCNFCPVASTTNTIIISSTLADQYQMLVSTTAIVYMYDPAEDGWLLLPSPALAGTWAAGGSGRHHPQGPRGFPTAGTTTTLTTNLNFQRNMAGYTVRIIAGPAAGEEGVIKSNTVGANSVITFTTAFGATLTTASEFIMLTGRFWVLGSGTLAAGSFRYYDLALNTWTSASITGLPASIATAGMLNSTAHGSLAAFATGTATAGGATTLTNSAKSWTTDQWKNYQVRITGGTGKGQFRTITSNTATALTVATWTTNPDATSVYAIEGDDNAMYFSGNGAVTLYKYSISGNSWSTLTPGAARSGAPIAGMSSSWVNGVTEDTWAVENDCQNGKWIYSFRGTTAVLDRYNIPGNTWESDINYAPKTDVFATGTSYSYGRDNIYIMTTTGRMVKYNVANHALEPYSQLWYVQGAANIGDRLFDATYTDGAVTLRWLYYMTSTQNTLFRMLNF